MNFTRTAVAVVRFVFALAILGPAPAAAQSNGQLQARIGVLEQLVATLQGQIGGLAAETAARQAADTALQSNINVEAAARQAADTTLQTNIAAEAALRSDADTALQQNIDAEAAARAAGDAGGGVPQNLLDLANYVSVSPNTLDDLVGPHVIFTGANVHIRNGMNATNGVPGEPFGAGATNGLGNFIVGYNETPPSVPVSRTGSHNLIVGIAHGHSSFGGFVAGFLNQSLGPYASVSGGRLNRASGNFASVSGGYTNTASGVDSSVSGGNANVASGFRASVSGGTLNNATGGSASVSGGWTNTASGLLASISGGGENSASGDLASVSGGAGNSAIGEGSTVSGGQAVIAAASYSHGEP